jgi:diguanylate cyclase (GGDEF)-like protein
VVARSERVAVLRDLSILDTPPEPAYDDLASLAASVCRSDVGAVNFVDHDRHWTKAIVGVDGGQGASVPATLSLCAATIRSDQGAITIGNTLADERWREHPFVSGAPGLRFYAGASIVVNDQPIGVVCVFGNEPREFTGKEEDALAALARQASANLELRERNGELRELAITDPLTGLANRTLLFDRFNLALAQRRRSKLEVGVLFCDVDDFKSVNDRFGHEVGDLLLCDIADRLRDVFRDSDTLARIAGDEFVVICPELQGRDELEEIAARLARSVATIGPLPDGSRAPNLTVGATIAEGGEGPAEALNRADAAMYAAKPTL